jgi:hypothetical protein
MAMCLDGALGGPEFVCNLLVELTAHDKVEYLALPRGKGGHQRLHFLDPVALAANSRVTRQRALDRAEQLLRLDGLGQEIFRASLDGPHGGRRVGMPGQEDDG